MFCTSAETLNIIVAIIRLRILILGRYSQVQLALQASKEKEGRMGKEALPGKWGPKESKVLLA